MNSQLANPEKRLAPNTLKVWLIGEVISTLITAIVLSVLFYLNAYFAWKDWIEWGLMIVTGLVLIFVVISFIRPFFLYKNWRYAIDEEFLQLKSGAFTEIHQLVPMTKIQAVETERGPILRRYGLNSVTVETMGSSHRIPALPEEIAVELRNQIAIYAKIKEVES